MSRSTTESNSEGPALRSNFRHDPFQIGFSDPVSFGIDPHYRQDYIVNCSAFQSRTTCNLKKSVRVPQTLFPVALGNVERNGLSRPRPLIPSLAFRTVQ
jgi:hypothetical protein